jgi:hypothetical protein
MSNTAVQSISQTILAMLMELMETVTNIKLSETMNWDAGCLLMGKFIKYFNYE